MTDRTSEVDAYLATQGLRRAVDEPGWYVPVPCGRGVTRKVWATDAPSRAVVTGGPYSWADIVICIDPNAEPITEIVSVPGTAAHELTVKVNAEIERALLKCNVRVTAPPDVELTLIGPDGKAIARHAKKV